MLSAFPELLFLAPFAALLVRVSAAAVFALSAWDHFGRRTGPWSVLATAETAVAFLLFVGLYTQLVAVVGLAVWGSLFYINLTQPLRARTEATWWLMMVLLLSLVVTGPGPFAFDLPL